MHNGCKTKKMQLRLANFHFISANNDNYYFISLSLYLIYKKVLHIDSKGWKIIGQYCLEQKEWDRQFHGAENDFKILQIWTSASQPATSIASWGFTNTPSTSAESSVSPSNKTSLTDGQHDIQHCSWDLEKMKTRLYSTNTQMHAWTCCNSNALVRSPGTEMDTSDSFVCSLAGRPVRHSKMICSLLNLLNESNNAATFLWGLKFTCASIWVVCSLGGPILRNSRVIDYSWEETGLYVTQLWHSK